MRFLLDQNLSPRLGALLTQVGHDVIHVRDIDLAQAADDDDIVVAKAEKEGRVMAAADTDFGMLLARSNRSQPSFMLVRRALGRRVEDLAQLILNSLNSRGG